MASIIHNTEGSTFVIPDYRELLAVKKKALLKREFLMLSENYGENAYIHKKNANQFEAVFSQEEGYLFGETVWYQFNKPFDMIYCELLPDAENALLVVVKSGSIYLDTQIPVADISGELVVFVTQQSNFEIYLYGDVPISETAEPGKFTFDAGSVKLFTVLDESLFENLPTNDSLQLIPIHDALKKQDIGVLPIKPIVLGLVAFVLVWGVWHYLVAHKKVIPQFVVSAVDPYSRFLSTLTSPAPEVEIKQLAAYVDLVTGIPGWDTANVTWSKINFVATIKSVGGSLNDLHRWASLNGVDVIVDEKGVVAKISAHARSRVEPTKIYNLQSVIRSIADRMSLVLNAPSLTLKAGSNYSQYKEMSFDIALSGVTNGTLLLVSDQLKDLPLVLNGANLQVDENGFITGELSLTALGN